MRVRRIKFLALREAGGATSKLDAAAGLAKAQAEKIYLYVNAQ